MRGRTKAILFLAIAGLVNHAFAKINADTQATSVKISGEITSKAHIGKAGSVLKQILADYHNAIKTHSIKAQDFGSKKPFVIMANGKILLEITTFGDAEQVLDDLKKIGLEHGAFHRRQISGFIAMDKLEDVLKHPGVRYAQASMSTTHAGAVTSQGDQTMRTSFARNSLGVTGEGIKVATISDSYNAVNAPVSYEDDLQSGDLSPVTEIGPTVDPPVGFQGTDEGRAMMQNVHDIAPGAELLFRAGQFGEADFANGIDQLVAAGADVINDDVSNFFEPWFQDGIVGQAATRAIEKNVVYLSAAGNFNADSYQSAFVSSGEPTPPGTPPDMGNGDPLPTGPGTDAHDFDPGPGEDILQRFVLPPGEVITLLFQWSQPFVSACVDENCPGPTTNLDIGFLLGGQYVATSTDDNLASGTALEILQYANETMANQNLDLLIVKTNDGPDPAVIKYVVANGPVASEFHNNSSASVGHTNADKVISVASVAYFNAPPCLNGAPVVNGDSSLGGVPILFDVHNQPLTTALIRENPDVTGPDGGDTTFFPPGPPVDTDDNNSCDPPENTFPNFYGTSSATPHVAGLVALILEHAAADLTPDQVERILETTAIDITMSSLVSVFQDPYPVDPVLGPGFDHKSGFGLVQAEVEGDPLGGALCGDLDRDGICNDVDACPDDPNKTKPGNCGCSATEVSCRGNGSGGSLWSYPTLGGISEAISTIIPDVDVPPPVLPPEEVLPKVDDAKKAVDVAPGADASAEDLEEDSTSNDSDYEGSSCQGFYGNPSDLWWMLMFMALIWRLRRFSSIH